MFFKAVTLGIFITTIAGIGGTLTKNEENYQQPDFKLNNNCQPLHVYLSGPDIGEPMDDQRETLSKLFVSHTNIDTSEFFLDPTGPIGKRMGDSIEKLKAFYARFNLLMRLGKSFLIENEPRLLIRIGMDKLLIRQTKETRWLAKVVSHKIKLIKIQNILWLVYNKLEQNQNIELEELESMKRQ